MASVFLAMGEGSAGVGALAGVVGLAARLKAGARWLRRWAPAAGVALALLWLALPPPVVVAAWGNLDLIGQAPQVMATLLGVGVVILAVGAWLPGVACLVAWMLVRAFLSAWDPVAAQTLPFVLTGVLLYLGALHGHRLIPHFEGAVLAGLGLLMAINAAVGLWNLTGDYPLLSLMPEGYPRKLVLDRHMVERGMIGLPVGQMTHPHHWALFMALGVPWLVALTRRWPPSLRAGVLIAALILVATGRSRIALAAAVVALAVLLWREWGRAGRRLAAWTTGALGVWTLAVQFALGPTWWSLTGTWFDILSRLSGGRFEVWALAFPTIWEWRWIGTGLGMWERWARSPLGLQGVQGSWAGWWIAAQNEPLQVWFELGVVGLGCGLLLARRLARDAAVVWRTASPTGHAYCAILLIGFLAMWVTIPFRIPALFALIAFAAARVQVRAQQQRDHVAAITAMSASISASTDMWWKRATVAGVPVMVPDR